MMKLVDVFLVGLTIMFLIIGTDQTLKLGFQNSYWAFMLALVTFFAFNYRKSKRADGGEPKKSRKKPAKRN